MCAGTEVDDDRRVVGRELVLSELDNRLRVPQLLEQVDIAPRRPRLNSDPRLPGRSPVGLAARTSAAHFANIPPTDFPS